MSEKSKEIKVKVKYDPNKNDTIKVKINPNATVSKLEEKVKETLGKLDNVPMGILKYDGKELNDKDKTLAELGIKDGSIIENENRVFIKNSACLNIYTTCCDENTTVKEFLKKLKGKNLGFSYIKLVSAGRPLTRLTLDRKLLGYQTDTRGIKYGATLHLIKTAKEPENDEAVFDLNNLDDTVSDLHNLEDKVSDLNNSEEIKNSNLVEELKTLEKENDVFNSGRLNNNPKTSFDSKKEGKNSKYPPLRIIVGIADLLLLVAAVATFLLYFLTTLSLSVAVPIVLAALFVVGSVLFFRWNKILPKILSEGVLKKINSGIDLNTDEKSKNYEKNLLALFFFMVK